MKTAVIIPALNEAGNIGELVRQTLAQPVDWVIVVDNGSTDDTAVLAQAAGATVVREGRRGYGYACAAGTAVALELNADILVYMDGDFSSLPQEMPHLLAPIQADEADLVLGSRALGEIAAGAMLPHQKFGNWLSSRLMSWLYHIRVTDLGPYRAIRAATMRQLDMQEMTFGWPTEMMVKTAKGGNRIREVPVSWHVRRSGQSKVSGTLRGSLLAGYYILGVTLKYAAAPSFRTQ
ncbi:MAG TPA: glycosyltransferase family 2 protein [Anaerolineae bacterium]|nr:glycosyltransferase family 2 protein [Anaerolineae bacterium]